MLISREKQNINTEIFFYFLKAPVRMIIRAQHAQKHCVTFGKRNNLTNEQTKAEISPIYRSGGGLGLQPTDLARTGL